MRGREPIRDVDRLCKELEIQSRGYGNPAFKDAADMLRELSDRHWSECAQIARYDDELRGGGERCPICERVIRDDGMYQYCPYCGAALEERGAGDLQGMPVSDGGDELV